MAAAARIGTEFAGYRIEAVVGRGGSSVVYRAEYSRLGIPVALKLLSDDAALDESFRERFVRESRLAAAISHPNIITIYDAGVWEDTLYIAMRFVGGGDLRARLAAGPLGLTHAVDLVAQAAAGLDAAHARGLVHRDVKPANLMLERGPRDGGPEIVYVSDFGLLKQAHSGGRATGSGDFLGTIDYVAPEQVEGRPLDARADVYSLGCVAFESLTGRPPFHRENDAAVLWAHMQEEPPAASAVRAELPRAVDDVLTTALAKRPDSRYGSCGELAEALRAAAGGHGRERRPLRPSTAPAARRGDRRTAAIIGGLFAALALGAAGATVAMVAVDEPAERRAASTVTVARTKATTVTHTVSDRSRFLLDLVPDAFRRTCRRVNPPAADFWDTYVCRPRGQVAVVRYSYARSGVLMNAYFQRRYLRAGVPRPSLGERVPYIPTCTAPAPVAIEEWNYSGAAGHQLVGRSNFGNTDGRVLCVQGGERKRSRIEWTTPVSGIYAQAEADNYGALLNWWLENAGPLR